MVHSVQKVFQLLYYEGALKQHIIQLDMLIQAADLNIHSVLLSLRPAAMF